MANNFERQQAEKEFQPQSLHELCAILTRYRIAYEHWGSGGSKTVEQLYEELRTGESFLIEDGRELLRVVHVASVSVFHFDGETLWRLVEDRQEFTNGDVRRRPFTSSVAEKIQKDEKPHAAALRGLCEELGVCSPVELKEEGVSVEAGASISYPGLHASVTLYKYLAFFSKEQFRPEGYVEVQDDKKTYFVWQPHTPLA